MSSIPTPAGPDLLQGILSTEDIDTLIQKLQEFLNSLECPYPDIDKLISHLRQDSTPAKMPILRLAELELLLYFSPGDVEMTTVENIIRDLSYLSTTNTLSTGSLTLLTRIKYNDLLTDYQLLFSPQCGELRLIDLVAKKINILALKRHLELAATRDSVSDHIKHKILVFYLMCDSDYRQKNVLRYLNAETDIAQGLTPEVALFYAKKTRLMSLDHFRLFVQVLASTFYPMRVVAARHMAQLVENHLDSNFSKLPNFYQTISLRKIRKLLLGSHDSDFDVEGLLYRMITANKFPGGAKIDQLSGYVHFSEKPQKYLDLDAHMKRVCDVVDSISSGIMAQQE